MTNTTIFQWDDAAPRTSVPARFDYWETDHSFASRIVRRRLQHGAW